MAAKRGLDGQLPPVPQHNGPTAAAASPINHSAGPSALSPPRFLGRMSWEKGMLDHSGGAAYRGCRDARPPAVPSTLVPLAETAPSPTKHVALTTQTHSLRNTTIPAAPHPSPTGLKKLSNVASGSRPMTLEESYDEVEKMLEEHKRQRKETKPRRIEALTTVCEQSPLPRHTFVFAPLNDARMLAEIAAQEAMDVREGFSKSEAEMDIERDVGGPSTQMKYFGPEARASYYRMYRDLHTKPQLFVDRDAHEHRRRGALRRNSVVVTVRRSTADPAGNYVLDLSDAYEHMVAHELLRLAVSQCGRYHFTRLEYVSSAQNRGQVTKLEMVKRSIQPSASQPETPDDLSSKRSGNQALNPVAVLFRRLDEDGSGTIELGELESVLRSCGLEVSDEQLAELLHKYDYDCNGVLQKREFADLFARVGFGFVDADGSGSLDVDELRRVFQLLGVNEETETNDAIARMLAKYDLDGSGEIDAYEFLEFMTSEMFAVPDDPQKSKDEEEAKLMRLEPREIGSGVLWQIPSSGQLTADLAHSGSGIDLGDVTNKLQQQQSADSGGYAVDLENFIQIYDSLSSEDQEECVKRLGWLNILDPFQPDRQYPPLDLSIHDERELVQLLAQLALEEGASCWQNASYRASITSARGDQAETSESMAVLPSPGWGRPDAVGPDSVKHHGTVSLRYHSGTTVHDEDKLPSSIIELSSGSTVQTMLSLEDDRQK
ncbi:Leucine-rich repeat-containing protein 74 [Phytophthora cinnamomi]|uniref:Leucine-rich repeat-containing protein 74 n=1 Tax=Phytophthora cinnamomi TaxID=4785 RepID=UPI00355A92D5|nr:Leucine-rich repeat-containing protein 74 [Phytophthora cinnamomi]